MFDFAKFQTGYYHGFGSCVSLFGMDSLFGSYMV